MIVVALATIYTVELLMAQATATGMHDYSTLSLAIGGWWYKVQRSKPHACMREEKPEVVPLKTLSTRSC
jgi:hypothetical protein